MLLAAVALGTWDAADHRTATPRARAQAAHLDNQYTVFGKVLSGDDILAKLEQVETRKEGIFVMPKHRITISSATVEKHRVEL